MTCLTGSTALIAACCAALLALVPAARADDATLIIAAAPSIAIAQNGPVAPAGAATTNSALALNPPIAPPPPSNSVGEYFANWFARVDYTQAEQPHWMTPLVTVTPRLEEEFRYDQLFERLPNGARVTNYDGGKGLELIPSENVEVILGVPPYQERDIRSPISGWGDYPFLLLKYRLLSANEENGNYIVTAFLQGSAPTGIEAFTANAYAITPTIAFGKGWGDFDIQATIGESFPTSHISELGRSLLTNVTFQYHLWKVLWPEFEINDTEWQDGLRAGKNQILLTPGVIVGRIPLVGRTKLIVGIGYQVAVSPHYMPASVLTPLYSNALVLTTRVAF